MFECIELVWARFSAALVQAMAKLRKKSPFPRQRGYLLLVLGGLTPHQDPDGLKAGTQTGTASAGAGFSFLSRVGGGNSVDGLQTPQGGDFGARPYQPSTNFDRGGKLDLVTELWLLCGCCYRAFFFLSSLIFFVINAIAPPAAPIATIVSISVVVDKSE